MRRPELGMSKKYRLPRLSFLLIAESWGSSIGTKHLCAMDNNNRRNENFINKRNFLEKITKGILPIIGGFIVGSSVLISCGTSKKTSMAPAIESSRTKAVSLEGYKVTSETVKLTGIEMSETLNDEGTKMVERPYKWFAGIGKADNKQVAIELAQREAYATISRVLNNAIQDNSERGNVANNGHVLQALTSHWKQVSLSIEKACEPFGNTTIEYNPTTKMYEAVSKIGIRGDRFTQLLNTAGNFKPSDLTGEDLEQFIMTNKSIMETAKGK